MIEIEKENELIEKLLCKIKEKNKPEYIDEMYNLDITVVEMMLKIYIHILNAENSDLSLENIYKLVGSALYELKRNNGNMQKFIGEHIVPLCIEDINAADLNNIINAPTANISTILLQKKTGNDDNYILKLLESDIKRDISADFYNTLLLLKENMYGE